MTPATTGLRRALLAIALLLASGGLAQASADKEADARRQLEAVRREIAELTERQRSIDGERSSVAAELREADRRIADAAAILRELERQLQQRQQELEQLQQRQAAVEQRFDQQRSALSALLRSAHALGRHAPLKLLLAQDDAARIGRALAYQRYLQQDRMRTIGALLAELAELARLQQAIDSARTALSAARLSQQVAIDTLEQQRSDRSAVLARLESQFADARARLVALGRDEAALTRLIEQLRDVFADIPRQLDGGQPLARLRGRLPRPVAGTVLAGFGGKLPDGRNSSGWLIGAAPGAPVHAIAHGRVAYADWLKGYGLLLILDHGDGFMSLYAANESLLKEIGDWVEAGDPIGTVGSSGGQPRPALYFELRRDGRPVDPKVWLGK